MPYHQLTEHERYQIYALKKAGHSQKMIANLLNRDPATISRELKRNKGLRGYRPKQAQMLADNRRKKARKFRKVTAQVNDWIFTLLKQELSPQQVADYLSKHRGISLHHETIYQIVYRDKRQGGDLYKHLRIASKPYRKRYGHYDQRGKIKNRVSISQRPAVVEHRTRIGDWEGDTIIGVGKKSALLTLTERSSLYTIIVRLAGKQAEPLAQAAINNLLPYKNKVKTLTFDNGLEFAGHEKIAQALSAKVYFAHPYASWERGTNENGNGLIRQYFPKGTDFNTVTDEQIEWVMERLNNRPRQSRGCCSPNQLFKGQWVDLLTA